VSHWSREEIERLLALAREREPQFAPLLAFLCSTGARRGEALGLKWEDVDLSGRRIKIRRAITHRHLTTPKSGRGRTVVMSEALATELSGLLESRRRESLERGWPEVPEWVFCSEAGGPLDERNVTRAWLRLRRRAKALGIRPLKLHCTRHAWATLAFRAGKSIRWVADQLGHADPALTLRVYAHAMREEDDLSFVEFGRDAGPGRPQTAPRLEAIDGSRSQVRVGTGAPGGSRTPDPQVRSLVLYPAELPARPRVDTRGARDPQSAERSPARSARRRSRTAYAKSASARR